jgi:hypothetical protein
VHDEAVPSAWLSHTVAGDIESIVVAVVVHLKLKQGEITPAVICRVKTILVSIHGECILGHTSHPRYVDTLRWGPQIKWAEGKYLVQRVVVRYSSQKLERYSHVHRRFSIANAGEAA